MYKRIIFAIIGVLSLSSFADVNVMATRRYVDSRTTLKPVTNDGEVVGYSLGSNTNVTLISLEEAGKISNVRLNNATNGVSTISVDTNSVSFYTSDKADERIAGVQSALEVKQENWRTVDVSSSDLGCEDNYKFENNVIYNITNIAEYCNNCNFFFKDEYTNKGMIVSFKVAVRDVPERFHIDIRTGGQGSAILENGGYFNFYELDNGTSYGDFYIEKGEYDLLSFVFDGSHNTFFCSRTERDPRFEEWKNGERISIGSEDYYYDDDYSVSIGRSNWNWGHSEADRSSVAIQGNAIGFESVAINGTTGAGETLGWGETLDGPHSIAINGATYSTNSVSINTWREEFDEDNYGSATNSSPRRRSDPLFAVGIYGTIDNFIFDVHTNSITDNIWSHGFSYAYTKTLPEVVRDYSAVSSVNGKTGVVELEASDITAYDPLGIFSTSGKMSEVLIASDTNRNEATAVKPGGFVHKSGEKAVIYMWPDKGEGAYCLATTDDILKSASSASEKKYPLFIIRLNEDSSAPKFSDIELKATTNNYATFESMTFFAGTAVNGLDSSDYGFTPDWCRIYILSSKVDGDVRRWRRIRNTTDLGEYKPGDFAIIVDPAMFRRRQGDGWCSDQNEELTWSFVRLGSGAEDDAEKDAYDGTSQLWRPIMPVKWYSKLPAWADQDEYGAAD